MLGLQVKASGTRNEAGWAAGWSTAELQGPAGGARGVIAVPELSKRRLASPGSAAGLGLRHETSVPSFSRNDAHSSCA